MRLKRDWDPEEESLRFRTEAAYDRYDKAMEQHFLVRKGLGLTDAKTKEAFYGFRASQIWKVHFHKQGWGAGLFFRLGDNRVIDVSGQPHDPNPVWYDATTH
jgi:hypothetical protein